MTAPDMSPSTLTESLDGAHQVHARWVRGVCPCCGGELGEEPSAVAEQVWLCVQCIRREHDADDVLPGLLRALVDGRPPVPISKGRPSC
jgi:hypothetical protein